MSLQEKFMQFQQLQQHIEQIQEHVNMINSQLEHLEDSKEALEELKKSNLKSDVLAPIANGIFVKTKLEENQKLYVNVGADTVVEKTVDQVLEMLNEQKGNMSQRAMEAEAILQQMHEQAYSIYKQVQEESKEE